MSRLTELVQRRIMELGDEAAAEFFQVAPTQVSQWRTGSKPVTAPAMEKAFEHYAPLEPGLIDSGPLAPVLSTVKGKVALLLPFYKSVNPWTAFSLMAMIDREKMRLFMAAGDAAIWHARNNLAKRFLKSECEWAFFIDDDVIPPSGKAERFRIATGLNLPDQFAGQHVIERLLSHGKSLVGALYVGRQENGKFMFSEAVKDPSLAALLRKGPRAELRPTEWVATGCMLIHRSVFQDISKKFPERDGQWFSPGDDVPPGTGEDITLCRRAARAGHQPFVDTGCVVGHVGSRVFHPFNTRP